jgi:membrane fusion protein, macrolide-specific efflux system
MLPLMRNIILKLLAFLRKYYLYFIIILFGLIGLFYFINSRNDTIRPMKGSVIEAVYGLGTVNSQRTYELKIGVTSSIRKIYVKEGESLEKGSKLIEFDSFPTFTAPFKGTITSIPFEIGEIVYPQVTILKMEDLSNVYIVVSLEQQGALRVKKGQIAAISFESLRGNRFEGRVEAIFPNNGQFIVHIIVDDLPDEILPGMTADVSIETGRKNDVLLIPVQTVKSGKIIRIRNGKKEKISIKLGVLNGEWAEVTDGDITLDDSILNPKK